MRCLDIEPTIEPINVGCGKGLLMRELVQLVKEEVGWKGNVVWDASKPSGNPHKVMDTERMEKVFNWKPQIGLNEGIKRTVKWAMEIL